MKTIKDIEEIKESKLYEFLSKLDQLSFIKSTDSITGEEIELYPMVKDMEAIIKIDCEVDREELKNLIMSLSN